MNASREESSGRRGASGEHLGGAGLKWFASFTATYASLVLMAGCLLASLSSARASDIVEASKTYPSGTMCVPGAGYGGVISTSGDVVVPNGASVTYAAATQIKLESGFSVVGGGTFHAQVVPVPVPTGLTVVQTGLRWFYIHWDDPPTSVGSSPTYEIHRYDPAANRTDTFTQGGTWANISALPGTTYTVSVRVSDANGNWSDWSAPINVSTLPDTTPPTIPTGFVPRSVSSTSLVLNWNPSTESTTWVSLYEIRVDGISRGTTTTSSYEITGLNPNTRYAIQVRARDWSGNWSPWSDTYLFITSAAGLTLWGENSYSNPDGSSGWTRSYINQTGATIKVHSTYDETYSDNAFGTDRHDADTIDVLAPNQLFNEMEATDVFAEQGYTEHRIQTMTWIETVGVPIITAATTLTHPATLPLTYTLTANNTPTSFSATGLPPGLTLASTGVITGTPTTAGTYRVAVSATNSYGTGNGTIVWTIIVDTDAPTPPDAPYLSDLGHAPDFTLNWAASSDNIAVTAYEVLKNGTTIGTYTTNSAPISFAYANSDYTVTVRARDAIGNWSSPSAPLVVHTNGVSVVGGSATPGASVPGSKHRLTADQPPVGKYFSGWTVTGPGSVDYPAMATATFTAGAGNTVLTANYAEGYQLRTYLNSDGVSPIVMGAAGGAAGQTIAIHAPAPNAGEVFVGWNLIGPGMIESAGGRDTTITLGPGPSIVWPSYWSATGPGLITALSGPPQTADVGASFNFLNSVYRFGSPLTGALYVDYSQDGGLSWTMSVFDHNPNLSWQGTAPYSNNLASYSFWSTMSFAQAGTVLFRTWAGVTRLHPEDPPPTDVVPIIPTFRKTIVSNAGTLPWTPQNVRAENVADTSFTLRWDPASGCPSTVAYEVYVTGYAHEGIMGSNGTNTFTNIGSLTPGTTYTFKVRARNWTETSAWSAPITISSLTPPVITSDTAARALVGLPFQYHIIATHQPTSYAATGTLPPGLTFDTATATLSGTPTTAGSWTLALSATNADGTGTASLVITSVQSPAITQQPASRDAVVGQSASFGVTAAGTPTLTYQWKKNGTAIAGATTATFSLASATTADAGYYTVTVTNAGGSTTSSAATLTVATDAAPTITQQPTSLSVVAGQPGGFGVRASGNPSPTYQWKKNGSAIAGATSSTYVLSSAASSDAGDYTVTVANSAGSITSSVATLTVAAVNTAPTISWTELPDPATTLHPGDPFYVRAQGQDADGNLTAVAVWRVVDGADVVSASAGGGDGKASTTPRVASSASDAGTITFKAKATDASDATSALITYTVTIAAAEVPPNVAPTIAWTQGPATATPGATFTVQAHATDENNNLASVQIWRDGQTPLSNGAGNGHDNDSSALQYSQPGAGSVLFHAKATDSDGASTTIDLTVSIAAATPSSSDVNKPVVVDTGDLVGTLPGSLSVDNKGTANYTISLPTPPGRAGLQPNLALAYNSGAGNGPVGLGWSISTGFPQAITRGRTILARDGFVGGPNLGEYSCRLYLDGRRLIQTSPGVASSYAFKDSYWKIGSKYRTEVDSFAELISTSADTVWVDGFTMTNKDGSVAKFGIVDSDNDAVDYAPNYNGVHRGDERAWAIKQLTDTLGNQVVFAYTNYTDTAGKRTGEQHIESITYTANPSASVAPETRIRFLYSPDDPDAPAVRPDHAKSSFLGGSELRRRLSKIEVDVKTANGDWETMRRFGFIYEVAPKSGLSRLTHVTSAWKDAPSGAWKSLPSTALTYQDDPNPKSVFDAIDLSAVHGTGDRALAVTGDFNGDGKTDRFANGEVYLSDGDRFVDAGNWINLSSINMGTEFVKTGDFDGDGKTDIAWGGGDRIYVARSNGHGFEPLSGPSGTYAISMPAGNWFDFGGLSLPKGTHASRTSLGDFNGDGRTDILIHAAGKRDNALRGLYVALSHGNGFDAFRKWSDTNAADLVSYSVAGTSPFDDHEVPEFASIEPIVADFNGDGADDYAWVCRYTISDLARLNASGQSTFSGPYVALDITVNVVFSLPWTPPRFSEPNTIHWQNNDGHNPQITTADYILSCIPADVNGDGLTDLLVLGKNAPGDRGVTTWMLYRNNSFGGFDRVDNYMPVAEAANGVFIPTYNLDYEQSLSETINEYWTINPDVYVEYNWSSWEEINGKWTLTEGTGTDLEMGGFDVSFGRSATTNEKEQSGGMFLVDINHDGRPDYLWGLDLADGSGWWVKYGTPDGFGPAQKLWNLEDLPFPGSYSPYTSMETREGGVSLESIDIDGDGAPDLLLTARHNDDTYYGPLLAKTSGAHADRLAKVTDGLGSETRVDYLTTANTAIYTPGVDVAYPIRERRGGQHVVSDVWRDSGSSTAAHFSYQYSGNRMDLSGRGALGFHSFVTLDHQTGLFKYQFLAQSFPMTGLTAREETYRYLGSGDFHFLSSHDNTVVFDEVVKSSTDRTPWGTVYPFISRAVESRWENSDAAHFSLGEAAPSSQPEALFPQAKPAGAHIKITAESLFDDQSTAQTQLPDTAVGNGKFYASDTTTDLANAVTGVTSFSSIQSLGLPRNIYYGNLKQLTTYYGNGLTEKVDDDGLTEKVVTEYKSPVGALTGLVDNVVTTVTSAGYGTHTGPVKRYTYFGSTPLVETETVDASGDTLDLKTTYTRDSLGRVTDTTISNTTATGVQAIGNYSVAHVSDFDAHFDLPAASQNAEPYRHNATTQYHRFFAQPTSVTDVNNAQVTTTYDALGRAVNVTDVLKSLSKDTTFGWTSPSASDWKKTQTVTPPTVDVDNPVTLSSVYAVRTTATVQPAVTAYYDRLGRTIRTIKEGFNDQQTVTDTVYDTLGRVVAVSLPYASGTTALWTKTKYDPLGRVATVKAPNGTVTTNTYNGRATSVTVDAPNLGGVDPAPQTNTTVVNAKGQTVKVWNADNVPTFDNTLGAAATNAIPSIEFALDGFGRMRKTTLKGQTQTITAEYDELGHQTLLDDPDKGSWTYVNNALGQVVQQTDARNNVTITAFDHLGRTLSRATVEPSSGPVELADFFYYDTATNASSDATLHLVAQGSQGWIGAPQRTEASTSNAPGYAAANSATATVHYYDTKGRPITDLTTIDGKWFYTYTDYDTYSRVRQVRYFWRPGNAEDASINPAQWQDFGFTYAYDAKSYILSLTDTTADLRTWWKVDDTAGYDHLDRPVLVQKGNGYWTKRTYRPEDGVLTGILTGVTPGSSTLQNLTFGFDGLGNLTSRARGVDSQTLTERFTYDNLNRLTDRTLDQATWTTSYFSNGNIKTKPNVSGTISSTFDYNATVSTVTGTRTLPHAVSSAWGYAMTYDTNGNMTGRTGPNSESWKLAYAGFDKPRWMTKTTTPSSGSSTTVGSEFLYDSNRSRTVQLEYDQANATTGEPTHYVRKRIYGLGPTLEANYGASYPSGTLTWTLNKVRIYVPGPDGVIGAREFDNPTTAGGTEKPLVYHYDHLGSIESITPFGSTDNTLATDSGNKSGRFSEDAWGARRNPTSWTGAPSATDDGGADSLTPRGFTGHEMLDDLGLVHMNGRIYDPAIGRFLSSDILVDDVGDLQGYNRYSYVKNRPLTLVDKTGFDSGYQFYQTTLQPRMFFQIAEKKGVQEAFETIKTLNRSEAAGAAAPALVIATVYTGGVALEAAAAGNTFAQLLVAGSAAKGLVDGTQHLAEGAGEISVTPTSSNGWANAIGGTAEVGLSVATVATVRANLVSQVPMKAVEASAPKTGNAVAEIDPLTPTSSPTLGEVARDAAVADCQGLKISPAAICGTSNDAGTIAIATTSRAPNTTGTVSPELSAFVEQLGGIGAKFGKYTVGACAEFHTVEEAVAAGIPYREAVKNLTEAVRLKPTCTVVIPRCPVCTQMFGPAKTN